MPEIVKTIPFALSGKTISSTATFISSSLAYDYALAGFPFLAAINDQRPATRELAQIRKQQFDNSQQPGEQSLTGWWLRSQSSFHGGTGLRFREPESEISEIRFYDSLGVNPWTPGQVTLLKSVAQKKSGSGTILVEGIIDGSTDGYLHADGTTLTKETTSSTAITWGGANAIVALTSDGTNYYASDSVGIYQGTVTGGAGAKVWNTGTANVTIKWVKQRLMAGIDHKIYELINGTGGPALPTAKFTHPNASWLWTGFAESGTAIYASGYAGATSAIYKLALDSGGAVPTLTQGTVTGTLPTGEVCHAIYCYLGRFLAIGTNKGVRIGTVDDNGNLDIGPLTIETSSPVKAFVGRDRFVYAAATNALNSKSGLYCVDLGQPIDDAGRYAYATDIQTLVTGTVASVTLFGATARKVVGVTAQGSYLENASTLETSGTLTTSNIRYSTLEPKLFKFMKTRGSTSHGTLGVSTIDTSASETTLITYGSSATPGDDLALTSFATPLEYVALKFTLTRDGSDTTTGPTLNGWQLKALPGQERDEVITLPLMCYDYEADMNGVRWGYEGAALDRWEILRDAVSNGDLVSFQDLAQDEARLVVVEEMRWVQTSPPAANNRSTGGILQVSLRAVA